MEISYHKISIFQRASAYDSREIPGVGCEMKWKRRMVGTVLLAGTLLSGCSIEKIEKERVERLSFEIVEEEDIPEELGRLIQKEKEPFRMTYADAGSLYIARGYGKQETDGYEIEVVDLYETENAIVLQSMLKGPEPDEKIEETPTYPYIVVRMAYNSKYVLMEEGG